MRPIARLGLLMVCALMSFAPSCKAKEVYRDKYVVVQEDAINPLILLNPHAFGDRDYNITVAGRKYRGLRGRRPPYYLTIPGLNMILFVTATPKGYNRTGLDVVFHFIDIQTGEEISVDGHESGFGVDIVPEGKIGDPGSDYIVKVSPPIVVLAERSLTWKEVYTINLKTKRMERVETSFFNPDGSVGKTYVKDFE